MAITLYDATIGVYLQILGGARTVLAKGRTFAESSGFDLDEITDTRLAPDMLPFSMQIVLMRHHSLQALAAAQQGDTQSAPPQDYDYAGLEALLAETEAAVAAWTPEAVNALEGRRITVRMGPQQAVMIAEDYFLSFAVPNFYFHASTAYDILRHLGAPIGKRDFAGKVRFQ
jgi:hypothetical protein